MVTGSASYTYAANQSIPVTQLIQASDPDGSVASYVFWDSTAGTDGGYVTQNGSRISGASLTVSAANLSSVAYHTGPQAGSNGIVINAIDNQGLSSADFTTTINVTASANRAPVVANPIPDMPAREGVSGSYAFPATTFSDPDGNALSYSATQSNGTALPGWLGFDAATRTFSTNPAVPVNADDVTVRLSARDPGGLSVYDEFVISTPQANLISTPQANPVQSVWDNARLHDSAFENLLSVSNGPLAERGLLFSTVDSAVTRALSRLPDFVNGDIEVTVGVEVRGEITAGIPYVHELQTGLVGLATGYNLTYDFVDREWTISRDWSFDLGEQLGAVLETYVTFGNSLESIWSVPGAVTVGIAVAGTFSNDESGRIGSLFRIDYDYGQTRALTFSAEATLPTTEFVNNYVQQGDGDSDVSGTEFAQGLADLLVPYYGDTWWENLLHGAATFNPVLGVAELIDSAVRRQDTFLGVLTHAPNVDLSLTYGLELHAGASIGLGGSVPVVYPPVIQAGGSVNVGITIVGGIEAGLILTRSVTDGWSLFDSGA